MDKFEYEIITWLEIVLGKQFGTKGLYEILCDGVVLCELINAVSNIKIKPEMSKMRFAQMVNISKFIEAAKKLGVPDHEIFLTVDLFENKNMKQVMICLYALSRQLQKAGKFRGPFIGPRLAEKNEIEFSQSILDQSSIAVHLQMGYCAELEKKDNVK